MPPAGVHFSTFLLFIFLRFYVFGNNRALLASLVVSL